MKVYRNTAASETDAALVSQGYQPYISIMVAAEHYGLSRITLSQAAREGRLTTIRPGRGYLTTAAWVEAAIEVGNLRPRKATP